MTTNFVAKKGYAPTSSFSGPDMLVHMVFPGSKAIQIGTGTTVTYSMFREKHQIRTLGRISNKGFTYGPRTIGGTIIFTVINQHFINDLKQRVPLLQKYDKIKPDELPPFDIVATFANEYGQTAKMVIYGVTIIDDGVVLSVEDILTESTMTYMARDIDHMIDTTDGHKLNYESGQEFISKTRPISRFTINSRTSSQQIDQYTHHVTSSQSYRSNNGPSTSYRVGEPRYKLLPY